MAVCCGVPLLWSAVVAVLGALAPLLISLTDTQTFAPGACKRVEEYVTANIVGQELAIKQLVDSVCTHISHPHPRKPLILSVHGPPGVGKTYTHTLLARALYNRHPEAAVHCPGEDCRAAKVIYGLDFMHDTKEQQLGAVRAAILEHARHVRDPLIVIEESDKLDCASRGMLRQLLSSPDLANGTLNRAIVLLESNLGFLQLEQMMAATGRAQVNAEQAERALRDTVVSWWRQEPCEEFVDTVRFSSMIDFFLPYFPLQRPQIEELTVRELRQWAARLWREKHTRMEWGRDIVAFLTDRVDFQGDAPLEGGKQVSNIATRYVARLVRNAPHAAKLHGHAASSHAAADAGRVGPAGEVLERGLGVEGAPVMRLAVKGHGLAAA